MFATRKEILEYAHQKHISFREDSSNLSTKYLRNKIRLGIIPRMREINQRFSFIMQRNVDRLTAAQRFIDGAIDNIFAQAAEFNGDICTLHIDRIENISSRDFVIYEMLNSRFGFKGDTVDNLCKALKAGNAGKRFYSRNYVAYVDRGNIAVAPIEENDLCEMTIREGQHRAYCGNSLLYFDICDVDSLDTFHVPDNVALLDIEKITFPLTLRRWKDGDTFIPFGMNGRKKVSDYLIDHKVSMAEKERQFVLLSDDEIAWLIGHRTSDNFRITDKTDKVLRVTRENIY
jgi:tRNA(Ile)-lysidine synthase